MSGFHPARFQFRRCCDPESVCLSSSCKTDIPHHKTQWTYGSFVPHQLVCLYLYVVCSRRESPPALHVLRKSAVPPGFVLLDPLPVYSAFHQKKSLHRPLQTGHLYGYQELLSPRMSLPLYGALSPALPARSKSDGIRTWQADRHKIVRPVRFQLPQDAVPSCFRPYRLKTCTIFLLPLICFCSFHDLRSTTLFSSLTESHPLYRHNKFPVFYEHR